MERDVPDTRPWVQAVYYTWDSRRRATPCGTYNLFCGCERCAALPEPPVWMASPEALAGMVKRVVAARPGGGMSWEMHLRALAHEKLAHRLEELREGGEALR